MLTLGPAPDPKWKFNASSSLTLPHSSDCFICAKEIIIIVFLLQMIGDGKVGGWFIHVRVWVREQGWVSYFYIFCSVFVML